MAIDTNYLNKVLDSVSEEGLTELEIQRRYYAKLDKELKGKDRIHLMKVLNKISSLLYIRWHKDGFLMDSFIRDTD